MAISMRKVTNELLNTLKLGMSKDNLDADRSISEFVLSSESYEGDKEQAVSNIAKIDDVVESSISLLLSSEEFQGLDLTPAQIEAGKKIAAIAMNPEKAIHAMNNLKPITADGKHEVVNGMDLGVEDMVIGNELSTEGFDSQTLNNAVYNSIVLNIMVAKQDSFGELFFPTITIDPTASGVSITSEFTSVYREFNRGIDGKSDKNKYDKKSLIKILYNNDIFGIDKNRVVPVKRTESEPVLYTRYTHVETVSGEEVETCPLLMGKTINILNLSQTDALLAKGVMDETDYLDRTVNLENLYFQVTGENSDGDEVTEYFKYNVSAFPYTNYVYSQQDHEKQLSLSFSTDAFAISTSDIKTLTGDNSEVFTTAAANHSVQLGIKIAGDGNVQIGDISAYSLEINLLAVYNAAGDKLPEDSDTYKNVKDVIDTMKFDAYDVEAYRINDNLRTNGQMITDDTYTQIINVPVRSGLSVKLPVSNLGAGSNNDSKIAGQIQSLGMKFNVAAVNELTKVEERLSTFVNTGNISSGKVLGIGRYLVNTYFDRQNLDLSEYVDSLESSNRSNDIRAALIMKIKDMVTDMGIASNYNVAYENTVTDSGKMTVIIGTDPKIAQYLTSSKNEKIDLGSMYEGVVAVTNNPLVSGKIYISFGVFDSNRNSEANPLNFGNMLYAPTVSVDVTKTLGGATIRVLQNFPRFIHVNNLPILAVVNVTGISSVSGKTVIHNKVID